MSDHWIDLSNVGPASPSRAFAAMAYHPPSQKLVLFGGEMPPGNTSGYNDDTWTWNGSVWTLETPASSPPASYGGGMAYHAASGKLVLFTGFAAVTNETWTWDGSDWTHETPVVSPGDAWTVMYEFTVAEHPADSTVVLFGGIYIGDDNSDDTWTWDGSNWTLETPASSPSPRRHASMAYDSTRDEIVLYGGETGGFATVYDDTWIWNGSNWTEQFPVDDPGPRCWQLMGDYPNRETVFFFGGVTGSPFGTHGDTWEWDGTNWAQLLPDDDDADAGDTLAYDVDSDQMTMFSGVQLFEWGDIVTPAVGLGLYLVPSRFGAGSNPDEHGPDVGPPPVDEEPPVVIPPTDNTGGFNSPQWGMQVHPSRSDFGSADSQFSQAVAAGATWVRFDVPWAWSEGGSSRPGGINWTVFETAMSRASTRGLKVVIQAGYCPQWANGGSTDDKIGPTSSHYQHWGDWVRSLASRCEANYPGVCMAIEYWNEPEISFLKNPGAGNATGDWAYYKTLAQYAWNTVRGVSPATSDAAPNIKLWAGANAGVGETSWNTWNWLDPLIADGPPDWFDEWSNHPYYWDTNLTGAQMTSIVAETNWSRTHWISGNNLADRLAAWGYTGRIHGSEWGCPTNTPTNTQVVRGTSEANQADLFELGWPLWKAQPRAGHLGVYVVRDINSTDTADPEKHFGAYRSTGVAKPMVTQMLAAPNTP